MPVEQLRTTTERLEEWLFHAALPLWWEKGADHTEGGYHEVMNLDGTTPDAPRRARVHPRQSYVYATAGLMGWTGPWRKAAQHGIDYLIKRYSRPDGQFCTLTSAKGKVLNPDTLFYDQAFALLAMATVVKALPERTDLRDRAHQLFELLLRQRQHPAGGFAETGARKFLSNPHMHMLEAMLAWCEVEPDGAWGPVADHIANLALTKFIDADGGFLREYFDEQWNPAPGADGHWVEPGHQFEWSWLLMRWGAIRRHPEVRRMARRLFENGVKGVDLKREAAVHAVNDHFDEYLVPTARLWAQTERIKAALSLAENPSDPLIGEALKGASTLERYLATPVTGMWRDRYEPDGSFAIEAAPASSFYHLICCIGCMREATNRLAAPH